ncbi:hypothetical protein AB6A40_003648 [Gnathostoma spinigerum]|uniref:RRM domain-containing protein n=1 Tax=Gnathostoma spinigerum TaxID=75299 RepID=A0ABD6EHX0_9BILA
MRTSLIRLAKGAVRVMSESDRIKQTVYLTHVKWVTGKAQLERYFSQFGVVEDITLFFDPETGLHRGFASLTFASADSVAAAVQNRPHVIDGDMVGIELFMPLKAKKNFLTQSVTR